MIKKLILTCAFFFLASCSSLVLHSMNRMVDAKMLRVTTDINYKPATNNKLDIYVPTNTATKATVIFFYGGCWGQCSNLDKSDYFFVAQTLAEHGIATVIPDFRQLPDVGIETIMHDSRDACLWVLENLKNYGIDSKKIFLMGHSSGAHIAALLANDERYLGRYLQRVTGFIGLAGPYGYSPFGEKYRPIDLVNGKQAAQLILHGLEDTRVDKINSIHYAEVLAMHNVDHELVLLEKISHAKLLLSFAKPFRNTSQALSKIIDFIDAK